MARVGSVLWNFRSAVVLALTVIVERGEFNHERSIRGIQHARTNALNYLVGRYSMTRVSRHIFWICRILDRAVADVQADLERTLEEI